VLGAAREELASPEQAGRPDTNTAIEAKTRALRRMLSEPLPQATPNSLFMEASSAGVKGY